MAKVRHAAATGTTPDRGRPAWLPAVAGTAAIALVAGVIALNIPSEEDEIAQTESTDVPLPAPSTPVHPASVPSRFEQHAKLALSKEFQDLAADISGARRFLTASLRSTLPGLGEE